MRCLAVSDPVFLIEHRFSINCHSYLFFGNTKAEIEKEKFQHLKTVKLKISLGRKRQPVVLCQVVTNPCCSLVGFFFSFIITHLIGHKTINIHKIFVGVHSFMGKTVKLKETKCY